MLQSDYRSRRAATSWSIVSRRRCSAPNEVANDLVGGIEIRTKFLGHSPSSVQPPPDLFETMI